MLYVLHGDRSKARTQLGALVERYIEEDALSVLYTIEAESASQSSLEQFVASRGLFGERSIVVLDGVLKNEEMQGYILENGEALARTDNVFFLLEEKIDAKTLKKLDKNAQEVFVFEQKSTPRARDFNIFSLSDAFSERNKKKAWTLYIKALRAGLSAEEIHGTVFWGTKNMLLVAQGEGLPAKSLGLNPWIYEKTVRYAKNFSTQELKDLSRSLADAFHGARRGGPALESVLEQIILSL